MKCPGCDTELQRHEYAQPVTVMGYRIQVRSFCDNCCRKSTCLPGTDDALKRLATGDLDPAEQRRVQLTTASWTPTYTEAGADA